jgi:hypothetical protein
MVKKSPDLVTVLPGHDDMLRRLQAFSPTRHLQEQFYPLILCEAGTEMTSTGIIMMLTLAIGNYTAGMHSDARASLFRRLPALVEALVDDEAVRADVFMKLREAGVLR